MRKLIFTILGLITATYSHAQLELDWGYTLRSVSIYPFCERTFAIDTANNVYSLTNYIGRVEHETGDELPYYGGLEFYLEKRLPSGELAWYKTLKGAGEDYVSDIATDLEGNIYVSMAYSDGLIIESENDTLRLTNGFGGNMLFLKLDNNGNVIWHKVLEGESYKEYSNINKYNFEIGASGAIYIYGSFNGEMDFDPGASEHKLSTINEEDDAFILKLDSEGDFIWVKRIQSEDEDQYTSLVLDDEENCYLTGVFNDSIDVNPNEEELIFLPRNHGTDMLFQKLDSAGNHIWSQHIGGRSNSYTHDIALDTSLNILVTGYVNTDDVDFDPSEENEVIGDNGAFLIKLNNDGEFVWLETLGEEYPETGKAIVVDKDNYIFWGVENVENSCGIIKMDENGNRKWGKLLGSTSYDRIYQLALDKDNSLYISGSHHDNWDIDPSDETYELSLEPKFVYKAGSYLIKYRQTEVVDGLFEAKRNTIAMEVFPNPSNEVFNLRLKDPSHFSIQVYDVLGKLVYQSGQQFSATATVNIPQQGMYFLKVTSDKGEATTLIKKN